MTTINDLFQTLISLPAGDFIEAPVDNARAAETLRVNLSSRYSQYRKTLLAVGVPEADIAECLKFKYDAKTQLAKIGIGAREHRVSKPIAFKIVSASGSQQ